MCERENLLSDSRVADGGGFTILPPLFPFHPNFCRSSATAAAGWVWRSAPHIYSLTDFYFVFDVKSAKAKVSLILHPPPPLPYNRL